MRISRAVGAVLVLALPAGAGGPGAHIPASQYAARLVPEPFRSHWKDCTAAMVPDIMRDQPLAHVNHRAAGLVYTLEAIRYLRAGQPRKAMFCASARSHYVTDGCCIAHADVWKPREEGDRLVPGKPGRGVWSFLPASLQDYKLPFGPRDEAKRFWPLRIDPPPLQAEMWAHVEKIGHAGHMHAFFDRTDIHKGHPKDGFPLEKVPDTTHWSAYDREIYGRWRTEIIALGVLDPESARSGAERIRFADARRMQAAFDDEMANMIASVQAYYRYLVVASRTELAGDLEELLPASDRLLLLARLNPTIHLSPKAPWPLKRACWLLASEIVRARFRAKGDLGPGYAANLKADGEALFKAVDVPEGEEGRRVLITWNRSPEQARAAAGEAVEGNRVAAAKGPRRDGHVLLRGEDLQAAIHLVDYLLDLTQAPLMGRAPMEVVQTVLRREWAAWPILEKLAAIPDEAAPGLVKEVFNPHAADEAAWEERVSGMIRPHTEGQDANTSGVQPRLWNLMILELPLPDGTRIDPSSL